jgi:hypothetical protein|tara:strand:- start:1769 stop:1945 length:177 start_codon:yes stop_codon:yes gene_type:complete
MSGYREVDMCCGSIADKAKLLEEFQEMEATVRGLVGKVKTLTRRNIELTQQLNEKGDD